MTQAILFALDALKDELDELTTTIDKAHFNDRRVQLRTLSKREGVIRSCISLLEGLAPTADNFPAYDRSWLHRGSQQKAG